MLVMEGDVEDPAWSFDAIGLKVYLLFLLDRR
jgi:hypothetical protein